MTNEETISKEYAVQQVRQMAFSFAELYYTFVKDLRDRFGEEEAIPMVQKVLFDRAAERAMDMIRRAEEQGVERVPGSIGKMTDVPFLGWDKELGRFHCPYGEAWIHRIEAEPWFEKFANLYCDVTDTTIAEVFTAAYSHKLFKNVVNGEDSCEREYFLSDDVKNGRYTYGEL